MKEQDSCGNADETAFTLTCIVVSLVSSKEADRPPVENVQDIFQGCLHQYRTINIVRMDLKTGPGTSEGPEPNSIIIYVWLI
jgi:hypothetical protein